MNSGAAKITTSKVLVVSARDVNTDRRVVARLDTGAGSPPRRSPLAKGADAYSFGDGISLYCGGSSGSRS